MESTVQTVPEQRSRTWPGWLMSGLVIVFMLMDAVMHLTRIPPVVEAFNRLGYPLSAALPMAAVAMVSVLLYAWPRTAILGAILLTGYLGGAVAIHLRVGSNLFGEMLFPVYVGILMWGGLYVRDARVRSLIPIRRAE